MVKRNPRYKETFEVLSAVIDDTTDPSNPVLRVSATAPAIDGGEATGPAGAATLTDTQKNWPVNGLAGLWIKITDGDGVGQLRQIVSNTADEITVASNWTVIPTTNIDYIIFQIVTSNASPVQVENIAGQLINPAKEDGNLATVATKTSNIDILISALRDAIRGTVPNVKTLFDVDADIVAQLALILTQETKGSTPTIYNKVMTLANTEYSQALPAVCTKLFIRNRTNARGVKFTFTALGSGTLYVEAPAGSGIILENIRLTGATIYMQSTSAADVAEILAWA